MSKQAKKSLLNFMKKQISEKSSKINSEHKLAESHNKVEDESKEEKDEEKMTEKKELEDAKKGSINKAAKTDQTKMIKKLTLKTFIKYTRLVFIFLILVIGLIQFSSAIVEFFNDFVYKTLMTTLHN
jgi:hypothetical protein